MEGSSLQGLPPSLPTARGGAGLCALFLSLCALFLPLLGKGEDVDPSCEWSRTRLGEGMRCEPFP